MFLLYLCLFSLLTNYFEFDLNTSKVPKCLIKFLPNSIDQYSISSVFMFSEYRNQKRLFGSGGERRRAMGELFHCHKTMSSIIVSLAPDRHREASSSSLKNTLIVIQGVFISKTLWSSYHYERRDVYLKDIITMSSIIISLAPDRRREASSSSL